MLNKPPSQLGSLATWNTSSTATDFPYWLVDTYQKIRSKNIPTAGNSVSSADILGSQYGYIPGKSVPSTILAAWTQGRLTLCPASMVASRKISTRGAVTSSGLRCPAVSHVPSSGRCRSCCVGGCWWPSF